jgi:flagellin-like protein
MWKKAIMGVETLILFIAMILVAAVAAGVLIRTGDVLQQKALAVGSQTSKRVAEVLDISRLIASDGSDGSIEHFEATVKLSGASEPIKFDSTYIRFVSNGNAINMRYNNESGNYFTNKEREYGKIDSNYKNLSVDFDEDYIEDYVRVYNSTHLVFNLSSLGQSFVRIGDISLPGTNILTSQDIVFGNTVYGQINITGTTLVADELAASMNVTITPSFLDIGTFKVDYAKQGSKFFIGRLSDGDAAVLIFETMPVYEGETIHLSLVIEQGVVNTIIVAAPDVMITQNIALFP